MWRGGPLFGAVYLNISMRKSPFSAAHLVRRGFWNVVSACLVWPSPRCLFGWRRCVLRLFGAKLHASARVYNRVRVWAPWNLEMGPMSALAEDVECYNVDRIELEEGAIVSQHAFLCTASHDIGNPAFRLVTAPIHLGKRSWICAGAFVGMGVSVGEGAVVAARSVLVKDVPSWEVVGGNPARFIKRREIRGCSLNS